MAPDGGFATGVPEIEGLLAAPEDGLAAVLDVDRVGRQLEINHLPLDVASEDGWVRLVAR